MAELSTTHQIILQNYAKEIRTRNLTQLKEIKSLLITIFGEENHQIKENTLFRNGDNTRSSSLYLNTLKQRVSEIHYTVTIYFAEITITNTNNLSHQIKNLYVRFYMDGNLKLRNGDTNNNSSGSFFEGLRTTFTPQEWIANYAHSHLPNTSITFQKFCTGYGPINQIIMKLRTGYQKIDFNIFLQSIKLYVKHESLEGRPHNYIANIGKSEVAVVPMNLEQDNFQQIFNYTYQLFLENYKLLKFSISPDKVICNIPDDLNIEIAKSIASNFSCMRNYRDLFEDHTINQILPTKLTDGRYSTIASTAIPNYTPRPLIEFKGQQKQLYVGYGNDSNNTSGPIIKYTHPKIIEYCERELSRIFTTAAIKLQNPGW